MNNTRTLAIVVVLTAATLVVGLTVPATMTPSVLAGGGSKKNGHDKYVKRGQDGYKKDGNGNTNTVQILKQNAKASGRNSTVEQNGENSICTNPSSSSPDTTGSCSSQSNGLLPIVRMR
jgi:hypothetical protein